MDAERGLMARVARGDQAAFTELAHRYSGKLLAVALLRYGAAGSEAGALTTTV